MVLVDEKGQAAAVEATFSLHGVRKPEQDVIFATNHYIAPEMQVFGAQTNPDYINTPYFQNSLNRTANLYKRFGEGRELTLAEMKATLMDHHSPGGLCQHPENNEAGWQTFYGALLLSHSQEIWINEGFPCADRFERYALS